MSKEEKQSHFWLRKSTNKGWLERKITPQKLREEIADKLRTNPNAIPQLHNILASLDINLFITTNYDHLLEDAFRNQGLSPRVITNDRHLPNIDPTRKTIKQTIRDHAKKSSTFSCGGRAAYERGGL